MIHVILYHQWEEPIRHETKCSDLSTVYGLWRKPATNRNLTLLCFSESHLHMCVSQYEWPEQLFACGPICIFVPVTGCVWMCWGQGRMCSKGAVDQYLFISLRYYLPETSKMSWGYRDFMPVSVSVILCSEQQNIVCASFFDFKKKFIRRIICIQIRIMNLSHPSIFYHQSLKGVAEGAQAYPSQQWAKVGVLRNPFL